MKISANGVNIAYDVQGKGENLVLIHAVGDNRNTWFNQVPVFSRRYRVITYDMRGFGETECGETDFTVPDLVKDLHALMLALGVAQASFVGHSLGGKIALDLAIGHPEMVKSLIFANSSPALTPPSPENAAYLNETLQLIEQGDMQKLAESSMRTFVAPDFKLNNPAAYQKYLEIKLQNKLDGVAKITKATLQSPRVPSDLGKVKCPVLLIVGKYDRGAFVEGAANIHKALADSSLVTLPTGHAGAVEAPQEFNAAVLGFLAGLKGR